MVCVECLSLFDGYVLVFVKSAPDGAAGIVSCLKNRQQIRSIYIGIVSMLVWLEQYKAD